MHTHALLLWPVSGPAKCGPQQLLLSPHATVLILSPAAEVHKVTSGLGEEELINLIPHFLEEVPDPVCVLQTGETETERLRRERHMETDRERQRERDQISQRHRERETEADRWAEPFPAPSPCPAPSSTHLAVLGQGRRRFREVPHLLGWLLSSARLPAPLPPITWS